MIKMSFQGPQVKEVEIVKIEDFYPLTRADLPKLFDIVHQGIKTEVRYGKGKHDESTVSFLLPLVIDLVGDLDNVRAMKKTFQDKYGGNVWDGKVSETKGFLEILGVWCDDNNGTGNLLRISEVLRSNGHPLFADELEKLFQQYSLPASSGGSNSNVYSLSRDFLLEEKKDIGTGSKYVKQALENSVIFEEVFKKLDPRHQKTFRLVSPTWMNESLPYWRRNASLLIHVSKQVGKEYSNGILLESFINLWEGNRTLGGKASKGMEKGSGGTEDLGQSLTLKDTSNYKLKKRPFHTYRLSYEGCGSYENRGRPVSKRQMEIKFWQVCGPYVEDLQIDHAMFNYSATDKGLFAIFDSCPNLKRLKISRTCSLWRYADSSSSEEENNWTKNDRSMKLKPAVNLHTLTLEADIEDEYLKQLIFLCPNLKTLYLKMDGENEMNPLLLLHSTSSGQCLKLRKLNCVFPRWAGQNLIFLLGYTEMLLENNFDSLQHLQLEAFALSDSREPPFDLYAALAHSSNGLKTLELNDVQIYDKDDLKEERKWFFDLAPLSFPCLTVFKFSFNLEFVSRRYGNSPDRDYKLQALFDFGTLKGMPLLERLEIKVKNIEDKVVRSAGTQDWIFEGDRQAYFPNGIAVDYFYSAEEPILCSKLKQFTFDAWTLNKEDIQLLSGWFPNLTFLEAELQIEVLPLVVDNWGRLEKLSIETDRLITLRELRPLKEKKKYLQIFQTICGEGKKPVRLEMKEHNGRLYFINKDKEWSNKDEEDDSMNYNRADYE